LAEKCESRNLAIETESDWVGATPPDRPVHAVLGKAAETEPAQAWKLPKSGRYESPMAKRANPKPTKNRHPGGRYMDTTRE